MGLLIYTYKFLFVIVFLDNSGVNGVEYQSRRTARSESRGLSNPIGMLSDQLLSSSSLIHQLISLKDSSSFQRRMLGNQSDSLDETIPLDRNTNNNSIDESPSTTESSKGPKSSALIDDDINTNIYTNDPYRWRPAKTPKEKTTSDPMRDDYSPEPFVYICRDPSKCRIPNSFLGTRAPLYSTTTAPPTYRKYGYRKINATAKDESKESEDDDYKTIYRSQIRKVKKKRPGNKRIKVPSKNIPNFNDMSLKELQDFMRHQSKKIGLEHHKPNDMKSQEDISEESAPETDMISSPNPFDLVMKEIKKIHKSNEMKKKSPSEPLESFPNHRPMKPFILNNPNKQLQLDIMMKNLQSFSDSSTTASTLTTTRMQTRTTAFTVRPTFLYKSSSTSTTIEAALNPTKTLSPFEIMLIRMKEKESSPSRSTPFTVRPTSTLRPKTEATTSPAITNNNRPYDLMSFKMKDILESSSPTTVFTVRPTSTLSPRGSTMSPFEMMVKRMKEKEMDSTQATVFTVRPTSTTTSYGSSQDINSELANLGISSLMKIMSNGAVNIHPSKKSTPSIMKPQDAVPTSSPSGVHSFMHFKTMDENISNEAEEFSQENEYDRPPRRPTDSYYHTTTTSPFTVRPTKKIYGHNYNYQRGTTATPHYSYYDHQSSTPFTVRPTYNYDNIYQHRTTKKVAFRPYQELNYQVRSTTPFTVFGKKKSYLSHYTTPRDSLSAFKHDVELTEPFSYDENSFMSGMKGLQHESKPHYIPDAQISYKGQHHDIIDEKSFHLGMSESDDLSEINPFKTHPFESVAEQGKEDGSSKFLAMNLSDYGHDDRPQMSSFQEENNKEEVNEEEGDYYDDFENYDLEQFINKLSTEKDLSSNENKFQNLPKSDNFEYISQLDEDISAPYLNEFGANPHSSFSNFDQSTTQGPNRISSFSTLNFPNIPAFDADKNSYVSLDATKKPDQGYYFRPDGIFSNTKIKLEPGSLPDRPTVFRDLPNMKEPHPQYPTNDKRPPPPPVPTTADFVSQYLKNPYGSNFIRMEIDQDRFKHNRTKPGSIHIPLMIKNYGLHNAPVTTPKPAPIKKKAPMKHHPHHNPSQHHSHHNDKNNHGKPKRRPSNKKTPPPKRHHVNPMKTILSDLKNLRKVMFNLPNAIQDLPSYMKGLVSNQASFAGRAFTDQGYELTEDVGDDTTDEKIEDDVIEMKEENHEQGESE
ncbi:uncharacterized protein [Lepeophtheirus salmonis]|uniref:uncharacterized protein n=1 Tax=Lepeophtheirus salmonis TaxID=72036 RepID=UPI001AE4F7AE|nr:nuclear pore complex protein DDB_G0274915-like [Lepeophtheirus salmonis]